MQESPLISCAQQPQTCQRLFSPCLEHRIATLIASLHPRLACFALNIQRNCVIRRMLMQPAMRLKAERVQCANPPAKAQCCQTHQHLRWVGTSPKNAFASVRRIVVDMAPGPALQAPARPSSRPRLEVCSRSTAARSLLRAGQAPRRNPRQKWREGCSQRREHLSQERPLS